VAKRAYLVGIEAYQFAGRALFARRDAEQLGEAFDANWRVELATPVIGAQAVVERLKEQRGCLGEDDTFWFYFAGHGFVRKATSRLLCYEGKNGNLLSSSVPLKKIIELVWKSGAGQAIVVCDCCRTITDRAGNFLCQDPKTADIMAATVANTSRRLVVGKPAGRSLAILLSCSPGEIASPRDDVEHGVFTAALLNGLRGGASHRDGSLSMHGLGDFVARELFGWSRLNSSRPMTPHLNIHGHIELAPPGVPLRNDRSNSKSVFHFSKGEEVDNLNAWLDWLEKHPESAAKELAGRADLSRWLLASIPDELRVDELAKALQNPVRGLWNELFELTRLNCGGDAGLLERLDTMRIRVNSLLKPPVSPAEYFDAKARLEEAEHLDPKSAKVAQARLALDQYMKLLISGELRRAAIKEAFDLARQHRWEESIRVFQVLNNAKTLASAETTAATFMDGAPSTVDVDGVAYVAMPAGMFVSSTDRIVALSPFLISRQPVTVDQYEHIMNDLPAIWPASNLRWINRREPIVCVRWTQAASCAAKAGGTLPSEAQWEYANRFADRPGAWPRFQEWCADIFRDRPATNPALDPCDSERDGKLRTVRRDRRRIPLREDESAEDVGFRIVLPARGPSRQADLSVSSSSSSSS